MYITPLTILALCIRIYNPPTVALCIKKTTIPFFTILLKACKKLGKSTIKPKTGHVIPGGEEMYSSILSLTLALDGGGMAMPCPGCFNPSAWSDGPCLHGEYFSCRGVSGSARMLHGLTHSTISQKQRKKM
jgi:hypothetical protein